MTQTGRVQILFPTSYSDSCFRAIRAVSQLVDTLDADLTLLHAFDPKSIGRRAAEEELASFFAEADNYRNSRRVAVEGDVNRAVLDFCRANPVHLAVVPSAQQLWLPRLRHRSRRAAMLDYGDTPLWTPGKIVAEFDFRRPVRRNAGWVDFPNRNVHPIPNSAQLAARSTAPLQPVTLMPEVHADPAGYTRSGRQPHARFARPA